MRFRFVGRFFLGIRSLPFKLSDSCFSWDKVPLLMLLFDHYPPERNC
jgi:hypothetical protein